MFTMFHWSIEFIYEAHMEFYHLTCTSFFLWMPGDCFTLKFYSLLCFFFKFENHALVDLHSHTPINSTTCLLHTKKLYFFFPHNN